AVWAEGWYPQVLAPDATTGEAMNTNTEIKILVDPAANKVTLRVPRSVFGDSSPDSWAYAAVVLSQEGYPSTGVWRVRDVSKNAEQWRLGGAPGGNNHTRVVDMVWAQGNTPDQAALLSNFTPNDKPQAELSLEDFALIPMFRLQD
ncbi:MAG TPA: glucodextranase DOMON-like domain-containing protein, partial [Anaerolineaceae bacterium]|nr:glucodextranase DOMON-like domain-containing protein [Anaerolineaceae bacterium]